MFQSNLENQKIMDHIFLLGPTMDTFSLLSLNLLAALNFRVEKDLSKTFSKNKICCLNRKNVKIYCFHLLFSFIYQPQNVEPNKSEVVVEEGEGREVQNKDVCHGGKDGNIRGEEEMEVRNQEPR